MIQNGKLQLTKSKIFKWLKMNKNWKLTINNYTKWQMKTKSKCQMKNNPKLPMTNGLNRQMTNDKLFILQITQKKLFTNDWKLWKLKWNYEN